jgi:dipeptidyl aminopeptidase/acylaminoacyl peptidase
VDDPFTLRNIVPEVNALERFQRFMQPAGLVRGGQVTPHWLPDGTGFWFSEGTRIFRVDGRSGGIELSPDVPESPESAGVSAAARAGTHISEHQRVALHFMGLDFGDPRTPRSYLRARWVGEPNLVPEAPSPDGRWFASIRGGNLVLRSPVDNRSTAITIDGTPEFTWDIEAPRIKVSAGLQLGRQILEPWSPDGNWLFAIKLDRRAVPIFPLVRYLKPEAEHCPVRIQRAGGPLDVAHAHVIDVLAKRATRFDLGENVDQYVTLVGWMPDGSEVLFTRHSRDFKTVHLLAGNPVDGSVRTILSESAETFVALQHDVIFYGDNHVTVMPERSELIWRSARSGWNHLYLYSLDGSLVRALTRGSFPVVDVAAVDMEGGWVYFTAHHDQKRPYDTHLCRVKFGGGDVERLTPLDGENAATISPSKKTFVVVNSRPDRPFRTDFHACDGSFLATVQQADISALEQVSRVTAEEFVVTASDGQTELWGVMYKPADFDPARSYPVIDHIYAGPQIAMVAHHFGLGETVFPRLDRALAQLGYIVISVDARGTPERSKAFQDVVYGNWGRHEIPDHAAAIRQLAQRHPFIDLQRVGVWGHSWGGYFTIRALEQAPDLFGVGVASAPGLDAYDGILYEPYLDLPVRAKAAYEYAGVYQWASKIEGKLMMIVGTSDPTCYSSALEMAHYLIQAGVDHELVVLPETGHSFLGRNEDYFVHKLVKHFETHLKPRRAS